MTGYRYNKVSKASSDSISSTPWLNKLPNPNRSLADDGVFPPAFGGS
jgi:hypothetical protein